MLFVLWKNKYILWELAKNDCKARFSSSILGAVWMILQPLVNMLVMWLVFQVGFKSSNLSDDIPFIIWYMPAFLMWNFFSESIGHATNSVVEYSYLLKKVNFQAGIIPPIKIISNGIVHLFFILFIIFINMCYGRLPNLYYLQSGYYFFCAIVLATALGWFFSSIVPFVPDMSNVVNIIIQLGFWITPIFWDPTSLGDKAQMILKLNPVYYVCMGYRDCFVYYQPVYNHFFLTIYFWAFTIIVWILGVRLYNKSKIHFVDVL